MTAARLHSLWRAWEGARVDPEPLAMSSWWIYHFDAHWRALTAASGPMHKCTADRHVGIDALPALAAPDGWFTPTPADTADPVSAIDLDH